MLVGKIPLWEACGMRPVGEDLLGYLLNALEEAEQAQVEAMLGQDEGLRQELEEWRGRIRWLEAAWKVPEPPPGLAERTCRWIAAVTAEQSDGLPAEATSWPQTPLVNSESQSGLGEAGQSRVEHGSQPQPEQSARSWSDQGGPAQPEHRTVLHGPENLWCSGWTGSGEFAAAGAEKAPRALKEPERAASAQRARVVEDVGRLTGRSSGWRWPDLMVVGTVSLLVALVLFGAIHSSRLRHHITQCQENLRQLGGGLIQYSELHQEQFPPIPTEGPLAVAGIYGPILITGGFVQDQRAFWCPGAVRQGITPIVIPTLAQLEGWKPEEQQLVLPRLGGAYGYSLGYVEAGRYCPPRNRHRSHFAVLADAPSPEHPACQSFHHGGGGQNVCFEDGHVEFVVGCRLPASEDHLFLNHQGILAPGIGPDDAVVAPATARPRLPSVGQ